MKSTLTAKRAVTLLVGFAAAIAITACSVTPTPTPSATPTAPPPTPTESDLVASYLNGTLTLELQAPSDVRQYDALDGMRIVLSNLGRRQSLHFQTLRVRITGSNGRLIWEQHSVGFRSFSWELMPGESITLGGPDSEAPISWDLRDHNGFPVRPGTYRMSAFVTSGLPWGDTQEFETPTLSLTVHEGHLPAYARDFEITLNAPTEATVGEPIPMDMRIANNGGESLLYWWSSDFGASNDLDIVVFRGDVPVWSAMAAHNLRGRGNETIDSGRSLVLSGLFGGFGEPWVWDFHGDCGEYRYERCESPVSPGSYTVRGVINVSPPGTSEDLHPSDAQRVAVSVEQPLTIRAR